MDHDAGLCQCGATGLVQAEPVLPDVAGHSMKPASHDVAELIAPLRSEAVEAVVLHHLAGEARCGVCPTPGPDEKGDLGFGDAAKDALDQGGTQEPGGAGDEEALGAELPLNRHRNCLPSVGRFVYHLVSGQFRGGIERSLDSSPRLGAIDPFRPEQWNRNLGTDVSRQRHISTPDHPETGACSPTHAGPVTPSTSLPAAGTVTSGSATPAARSTTSERILDSALSSFARRGYEATSLDAMAKGLEITKQSILYWFPSKDALLEAVIARSALDLSEALESALSGAGRGWDRVEAVVRSVFRLAAGQPELLGLLREVGRLGPPAATQMTLALEPLVQRASAFLEAEMDAGTMRRHDPRLLLLAIYSTVIGMVTEVEVLRALGEEPTARSLVRRRADVLRLLRSALVVEAQD